MTRHGRPHHYSAVTRGSDAWARGVRQRFVCENKIRRDYTEVKSLPASCCRLQARLVSQSVFSFFLDMKKESCPPHRVSKL